MAKGYTQQEGVDYLNTFSHVAKLVYVKMMLAISTMKGYSLYHLDVNNVFLHGDLKKEIYMELPPDLCSKGWCVCKVCRLHKSLYRLKQASRQWFLKLTSVLAKVGLKQSSADHSFFHMHIINFFLERLSMLMISWLLAMIC